MFLEKCHLPLGLENGILKDNQITASTYFDEEHQPYYSRLRNDSYWRPSEDDVAPWIQVSFTHLVVISGLVVQGSGEDGGWVENLEVTYSFDGRTWNTYNNLLLDITIQGVGFECLLLSSRRGLDGIRKLLK